MTTIPFLSLCLSIQGGGTSFQLDAFILFYFSLVPAKGAEPHRTTYTCSEEDHLNTKGNKTATDQILSRGVRVGYPITGPYALSLMLCLVHQVSFFNTFFFFVIVHLFFFKLDKRWLGISLPLLPFKKKKFSSSSSLNSLQ